MPTLSYLGHASFKIKGSAATVVTDPYQASVGFSLPNTSADVVTISHDHADHHNAAAIKGTARRAKPFVIEKPGAYEVEGISVFGTATFHDGSSGTERGGNIIYRIVVDDVVFGHLGDLGHLLSAEQRAAFGDIDVLLIPVGGQFSIDPEVAKQVINQLEPSIIVPMHYLTSRHDEKLFADLQPLSAFLNVMGVESEPVSQLSISQSTLPEEPMVQVFVEPAV